MGYLLSCASTNRITLMWKFRAFIVILYFWTCTFVAAQCPIPDFTVPSGICLGTKIIFSPDNPSTYEYEWDLCAADFDQQPTASVFQSAAGSAFNVELIEQDGEYFGFYTSRANGALYRLDFGRDINSTPVPINLGNLGIGATSKLTIEIVKEGSIFYGFVIDFSNRIYRFDFGTSLTNNPSPAEILYENGFLSNPIDLKLAEGPEGKFAFVVNYSSNFVVRFDFGNSYAISGSSVLIDQFSVTGSGNLSGISFAKICDLWHAVTTSAGGGQISKIMFDDGLDDATPSISQIVGLGFTPSAPSGVSIALEGSNYYVFTQSQSSQSNLYKIDFGSSLANSVVASEDLGALGMLSDGWGFSMHKVKSDWLVLSSQNTGQKIFRITFANHCFSSQLFSLEVNNQVVATNAGSYFTSLTAKGVDGTILGTSTKPITVANTSAPDISFSHQNVCANNDVLFFNQNTSGDISSYLWSFGDLSTSNDPNPIHQYASANSYDISLSVIANNNCVNSDSKTIKMYEQPSATFTLASGLICTNNEFTFVNNTVDDFDGDLTYQWLVNETPESTERDFDYTFTSEGNKDIKLVASIPGCASEVTQTLNDVQAGPTVGFLQAGQCEDDQVLFTNTSSGDIASYLWDFGDGQTSETRDATIVYANPAQYLVSLETIGTNGCVSSTSKTIPVYSKPQPNFSLDLPPFSCAGSPSQFNDLTPAPSDSNLSSWNWRFGDTASGTGTVKNPTYTYALAGPYSVELSTTTNYGCTASIVKPVQIADPPKAGFTISPSCLNQPTYFTDASTGTNKSWLWKIGNSFYALQNPAHVFSASGNFSAQLTVTGSNDCVAVLSKPINVPVPPITDFTVKNNCAGQVSVFVDVTTSSGDPVISRAWDFGGQGVGTGTPAQFKFQAPGTYNVKLMVANQSGCSYTLAKNTSIVPPPVADFITSVESGPSPLPVDFINTSTNANAFLWRFNDPTDSISTEHSPSFTYYDLGDYVIDLTATNPQGCADTKSKLVSVIVPYTEIELQGFELLKDDVTGSVRPVLTIKNNSNHTVTNLDIYLDIAGNATVKEELETSILAGAVSTQILNYELLPGSSLSYLCAEVYLSDDANLKNNSECISLQSDDLIFHPYPNPSQGQLNVDWITGHGTTANVLIVNSFGQKVFSKQIVAESEGLNQLEFDVSNLSAGVYILIFQVNGTKTTFRFTIV